MSLCSKETEVANAANSSLATAGAQKALGSIRWIIIADENKRK